MALVDHSFWVYPWDLNDTSVDDRLGAIRDLGATAISIPFVYHSVRALAPHNMLKPVRINLLELLAPHPPRTNFHVIAVDEKYTLRVAKTIGRLPWHSHPNGDEGWFIFEGRLGIHTTEGILELNRGDFTVIPRGMRHSPEALVPNTIVIIFNRRDLGMTLEDPNVDLGGFKENDLTMKSNE